MPGTEIRCRVRDLGIKLGILPTGMLNSITDVPGVQVGHLTISEGNDIRTGVTTILPHGGNLYQEKVPAGISIGNGFGKLMGGTQIAELGEIETPILLTNTLAIPLAAEAVIDWTLSQPGNENVTSVNSVVGETNDSWLNNIRKKVLNSQIIQNSIYETSTGPVVEGCIGAGTGTVAFGWKGGIGTSSRLLPHSLGGFYIGALVQSNFGGILQIAGIPVGQLLDQYYLKDNLEIESADGSIMIIIATNAPLSDRNLARLAKRAFSGLARTGASLSDGSGDYAIAFSTNKEVRRTIKKRKEISTFPEIPNHMTSPLFEAAIEATEEAIHNSLCAANTTKGFHGTINALPLEKVKEILLKSPQITNF